MIELKLASGISNPDRLKDLSDVQELIKLLDLRRDFATGLSEYVRGKFEELWLATQQVERRYVLHWRNPWPTADAKTVDDMIGDLRQATELLAAMKEDGVRLEARAGVADIFALLWTTDPDIARKYGMQEESAFLHDRVDGDEE